MNATGPRIEIVISPKGEPTTTVFGVTGAKCHTLSEAYEQLFGDVVETCATAEAYESPEEVEIKSKQK